MTKTKQRQVIIDVTGNAIHPLYEYDQLLNELNTLERTRGDIFHLATEICPITVDNKMRLSGADSGHYQTVNRPDRSKAKYEIGETWVWTGHRWLKQKGVYQWPV